MDAIILGYFQFLLLSQSDCQLAVDAGLIISRNQEQKSSQTNVDSHQSIRNSVFSNYLLFQQRLLQLGIIPFESYFR
jgi:hypothetical protein